MEKFDVVIIGSGVGGGGAAYALNSGGKNVALIENDLMGGTCPNRGCDPKKVLMASVEALDAVARMDTMGVTSHGSVNWPDLMAFKRTFTDPFPQSYEQRARESGITVIKGTARLRNAHCIEVDGQPIETDTIVIATGQLPRMLDIDGKEYLKTSNDFLDLNEMPPAITFIGAGYIAFELAAIAHTAGSDVTIIHHNNRPLKELDESFVDDLVAEYTKKGIRFVFNEDIKKVSRVEEGFLVEGDSYSSKTAYVVCTAGREPNIANLNLEAVGISFSSRGIEVDEHLHATHDTIFACGDVLAKKAPKLTPTASFEGRYVADVILGRTTASLSYPPVVSIVFSSPKLAQIGVTTAVANKEPEHYSIDEIDMTSWFTYRRINDPVAKVRLVRENGKLVGASAINSHADELINYLAFFMGDCLTKEDLNKVILGSPTIASDLPYLV